MNIIGRETQVDLGGGISRPTAGKLQIFYIFVTRNYFLGFSLVTYLSYVYVHIYMHFNNLEIEILLINKFLSKTQKSSFTNNFDKC